MQAIECARVTLVAPTTLAQLAAMSETELLELLRDNSRHAERDSREDMETALMNWLPEALDGEGINHEF